MQTSFLGSKFYIQSAGVTLKMRSRSSKFNLISSPCPSGVSVQVWSPTGSRDRVQIKAYFYCLYGVVTLKIRSRLPKANQIFKPSCHNI